MSEQEFTLQQLLEFTDDELVTNREGQMSEMQNYRLRVRRMWTVISAASITLILVIIATMLILFARYNASAILFIAGAGITICSAAIMGVFTRYFLRLNNDIKRNEIMKISGTLERVLKPVTRRSVSYILRIGEADVVVSREVFKLFEHGAQYTLYRTPFSGILLSAEKDDERAQ